MIVHSQFSFPRWNNEQPFKSCCPFIISPASDFIFHIGKKEKGCDYCDSWQYNQQELRGHKFTMFPSNKSGKTSLLDKLLTIVRIETLFVLWVLLSNAVNWWGRKNSKWILGSSQLFAGNPVLTLSLSFKFQTSLFGSLCLGSYVCLFFHGLIFMMPASHLPHCKSL